MRGRRLRTFDDRGIHPFSEAMGRVAVLASHPDVVERIRAEFARAHGDPGMPYTATDPLCVKQAGEVAAFDEFRNDVKEGKFDGDDLRFADLR